MSDKNIVLETLNSLAAMIGAICLVLGVIFVYYYDFPHISEIKTQDRDKMLGKADQMISDFVEIQLLRRMCLPGCVDQFADIHRRISAEAEVLSAYYSGEFGGAFREFDTAVFELPKKEFSEEQWQKADAALGKIRSSLPQ